jgi:peptidoglycan LD-endopeptidase CwlK
MHVNTGNCPACVLKLKEVCAQLVQFALDFQKANPDAHISCGYRTAYDQQLAYNSGHSKALPGQSKHNIFPAQALDWFRLTQSGGAAFERPWYQDKLGPAASASGLVWGGLWNSIKDFPHVEISLDKK